MEHIIRLAKVCRKCKLNLPIDRYRLDRTRKDGHLTWCIDCWKEYRKKKKEEKALGIVTVTSLGFTWNKYGGTNYGILQKDLTPQWYCQACREIQTDDLPPYMFEYPEREYIRICSKCQFEKATKQIESFIDLIQAVRRQFDI